LFLITNARAELELRATGSGFARRLASNAQHVLYDSMLELVWFSDGEQLWVIDLRNPALGAAPPILIAAKLPPHVELQVDREGHPLALPIDACDLAPILVLHWAPDPWIEADQGQRSTDLPGKAWLQSERARVARSAGEERWLHPSEPHVALSPSRAHCEDAEWCGASQAFAAGWDLVLADQDEGADCWHFGCLLFDSHAGAFGTPPLPSRWGPAEGMPSGPCGPYRFDAAGSAFLVDDLLCTVGGSCKALGGTGLGWLTPGVTLGTP